MSAYIDYSDLIAYADATTIAELLSDDGTPIEDPATDTKLAALMAAASGQVEAACGVSDLYSPDDLAALSDNALALLQQLVSQLTMIGLVRRRPEKYGSEYWQQARAEVEEFLDRLRKGERLFDDPHKREAGLPTVDGPSAATYQTLNLLPSRTRNYFPNVAQRLPIGRG